MPTSSKCIEFFISDLEMADVRLRYMSLVPIEQFNSVEVWCRTLLEKVEDDKPLASVLVSANFRSRRTREILADHIKNPELVRRMHARIFPIHNYQIGRTIQCCDLEGDRLVILAPAVINGWQPVSTIFFLLDEYNELPPIIFDIRELELLDNWEEYPHRSMFLRLKQAVTLKYASSEAFVEDVMRIGVPAPSAETSDEAIYILEDDEIAYEPPVVFEVSIFNLSADTIRLLYAKRDDPRALGALVAPYGSEASGPGERGVFVKVPCEEELESLEAFAEFHDAPRPPDDLFYLWRYAYLNGFSLLHISAYFDHEIPYLEFYPRS